MKQTILVLVLGCFLTGCSSPRARLAAPSRGEWKEEIHEFALPAGLTEVQGRAVKKLMVQSYSKGRSDAVKQQYWILVNHQKSLEEAERKSLYEIVLPEQVINGVILSPSTHPLQVQE